MLYGTMLIKVNKSFIKQLIMHFAGMGSEAGAMLIKVNKSFITELCILQVKDIKREQCLLRLISPLIYTY